MHFFLLEFIALQLDPQFVVKKMLFPCLDANNIKMFDLKLWRLLLGP